MKAIKKISLLFVLALICFSTCFGEKRAVNIPKFNLPVLITSAGQSIETQMVSFKCQQVHIRNTCGPLATTKDLEGIKTLIIVPGHSLKGLGSAGIDAALDYAKYCAVYSERNNDQYFTRYGRYSGIGSEARFYLLNGFSDAGGS